MYAKNISDTYYLHKYTKKMYRKYEREKRKSILIELKYIL